jgi:hypothetical protein
MKILFSGKNARRDFISILANLLVLGLVIWLVLFCIWAAPKPNRISNTEYQDSLQPSYTISVGSDTYQILTAYLSDSRNRQDGVSDYVSLRADLPDLLPVEGSFKYNRAPNWTETSVDFFLSAGRGHLSDYNSHIVSKHKGTHFIPTNNKLTEGLVHIGTALIGDREKEQVYVFVKSGKAISWIECGIETLGCIINQGVGTKGNIRILFKKENLDWYGMQGGHQQIADLVNSWIVND